MRMGSKLGILTFGFLVGISAVLFVSCQRSDNSASAPARLDVKAENLRTTRVSASMDCPMQPGTNLVWCGTLQIAWNQTADFFGEDLQFREYVPLAAILNQREFTTNSIDQESYVAAGGPATSQTMDQIQSEVRRKFGPSFRTELTMPTNNDQMVFFYACMFKSLEFEKEFHRFESPLLFGTNKVATFGIEMGKPHSGTLYQQIRLLDYRGTNDFILELITKSKAEKLILAKVPPQSTLAETAKEVARRITNPTAVETQFHNVLIPKSDFKLERTYEELLRKHLDLKKTNLWNEAEIIIAEQLIRFRLDERGALLKSEAALAPEAAAVPLEDVDLVFDQPFLVLMQRADAHQPYFALWIDNAELLVPWE
jgi:hypothetical protein